MASETVRIPLFGFPNNRLFSSDKDQFFKNCYPQVIKSGVNEQPLVYVIKRFGHEESLDTTHVAAGRGFYAWDNTGELYSVIGDRIYKGTTELTSSGSRLNNTTGRAYFTEVRGGTPRLVLLDGQDMWTIRENDTVTEVTDSDFTGINNIVDHVVNLDGYIFVMNDCGEIYQSSVNDPETWDSTEFLTSSLEPDQGVGIVRHLNYIVAFNKYSIEFFYNAGNASGSVLSPVEGLNIRWGCAEGKTIWSGENSVIFVGQGQDGGKAVMTLSGNKLKAVSTKPVERILDEEKDGITDAYAYGVRIGGEIFYVLTLPTNQKRTLVCNLKDEVWWEITSDDGSTESYWHGVWFAEDGNNFYILGEDDGKIYRLDIDLFQDAGNDINVECVTNKVDFGNNKVKFMHSLEIVGDTNEVTSAITLDWTDDDFQTYSNSRTVDMTKTIHREHMLGSFIRRAFRLRHTDNAPLRLEALEAGVSLGGQSMSAFN